MNKEKKIQMLNHANARLKSIVNDCQNPKFNHLEVWEDFQSKSFEQENKNLKPRFKKYKRGTIIFVNFGTSIGSELSGNHFAIVLNKDDNPLKGSLTVLPLSSKQKKHYITLGKELIQSIIAELLNKTVDLNTTLQSIKLKLDEKKREPNEIITLDNKAILEYINKHSTKNPDENGILHFNLDEISNMFMNDISLLTEISNFYKKFDKISYAMIDSITTVSKYRIKKPINHMDPVGIVKVSNDVLNIIEKKIIEKFTC